MPPVGGYGVFSMALDLAAPGARFRVLFTRGVARFGFKDDSFLLVLAVIIGIVTGAAAVGFHELINFIRDLLYKKSVSAEFLYGNGVWLLVLWPTVGGLAVGAVSRYVFRTREGHGIVDVVESVVRSSGFQRPRVAVEKIITSALTIGSGGSTGAEGPIVQIGAAISSGVGELFGVARSQMPLLTGCGCAAGISAIFSAPVGGVLFTLEVILQDFSIRTFTPVVLASVIAQITSRAILDALAHGGVVSTAIFAMPAFAVERHAYLQWRQVGNFIVLGFACALCGLSLTRLMGFAEHAFGRLRVPPAVRPAIGGAMLGVAGVLYIFLFGHLLLHSPNHKPFPFTDYPMPAFFGDGYGIIQRLFVPTFYSNMHDGNEAGKILLLLLFLCVAKVVGTGLTLGSGGSGGIIAPSVFIGASIGAIIGYLLHSWSPRGDVQPEVYALVGMGAVLAAVVHAPLASILICFELTNDYKVMLPAMLACIVSTSVARVIYPDSIYTLALRSRGVRVGGKADFTLLRSLAVEQVPLEPAMIVHQTDPFGHLQELASDQPSPDIIVVDEKGRYLGMIVSSDVTMALLSPGAALLLTSQDLMRTEVPLVKSTDDLGAVLDVFARSDVSHLPVCTPSAPDRVIGLISRAALMRRYQEGLREAD